MCPVASMKRRFELYRRNARIFVLFRIIFFVQIGSFVLALVKYTSVVYLRIVIIN